jgi:hypothetical protein
MTPAHSRANNAEIALIKDGIEQTIRLNDLSSMQGISKTSHYAKDPKSLLPIPNYQPQCII